MVEGLARASGAFLVFADIRQLQITFLLLFSLLLEFFDQFLHIVREFLSLSIVFVQEAVHLGLEALSDLLLDGFLLFRPCEPSEAQLRAYGLLNLLFKLV